MKITVLFSILLAPAAAGYCAEGALKTFPAGGIAGVYADTENGPITVSGAAKGDITVEVLAHDPAKCKLTMAEEGGRLQLSAEGIKLRPEPGWRNLFGLIGGGERTDCHTGFKISVPGGRRLEARSGTGDIAVSEFSGEVLLKTGTGDMQVGGLTGNLDVKAGTGNLTGDACAKNIEVKGGTGGVSLAGLCGSVKVKTGTGGVRLEWAKVPASGSAEAVTGTSDIAMVFPARAEVAVIMKSGTGSVKNEFGAGGTFEANAKSGTGDIAILKAK